jgi:hypothetical protein
MPNWCENVVTFTHKDPTQIERLATAFNKGKLFGEFFPCPPELLENYGWYQWCVENWGTKWDINTYDSVEYTPGDTAIAVDFDTAWTPPIGFYREMEDKWGFEVEAFYHEPGAEFAGSYSDGDNECYGTENLDDVPENLIEMFGLETWVDDEEENIDVDLDGGLSAVNEQDKEPD